MSDQEKKIERLYQAYVKAQAELKQASVAVDKAKLDAAIAAANASRARDDYNQALAEYR